MRQVLLFPEHIPSKPETKEQGGDGITSSNSSCFLAITSSALGEQALQSLTCRMMRWSDDIWLLDLKPCLSYWLYQADRSGWPLYELLRQMLTQVCSEHSYYAAVASDPWQALILLRVLEEQGRHGLIGKDTGIGENLYREVSWSAWWRCCEEYVLVSLKRQASPGIQQRRIKQNIRRMEILVKRLGIRKPIQLYELPEHQIQRRFGEVLAELWKRTFAEYCSTAKLRNSLKANHDFFPWINHELKEKIIKKRTLDYPVLEWNYIEVFLCADLNSLCFLDSFKEDVRIISLEWRIVLQDHTEICIIVPFRHPHDIHRDTPHQRTALLQARYQFEKEVSRVEQHYRDIDSPPPPIISWELEVKETLKVGALATLLFQEDCEDDEQLLELENKLPIALQAYHSTLNWIPEDSYHKKQSPDLASNFNSDILPEEKHCLTLLARCRPLYIYPQPIRFQSNGASGLWKFQERTMDKWWLSYPGNQYRDYYRYVSEERSLWVFQNTAGHWYIHGVFA